MPKSSNTEVAVVSKESKYSLIGKSGKSLAEIPYRVMGDFHSGLLRVVRDRWKDPGGVTMPSAYGYIDTNGAPIWKSTRP